MIKIAVCDDDRAVCLQIEKNILEYGELSSELFETDVFTNGLNLVQSHSEHRYDLIFLDIEMPELDGLETAKKINEQGQSCGIIYVTSHADFALRAFSVHPFGYIVKPVTERGISAQLDDFLRFINTKKPKNEVCFDRALPIIRMNTEDILYFEYTGKREIALFTTRDKFFVHYGLNEIMQMVEKYGFAMPHKSFIVNLLHISRFCGLEIIVSNGDVIPVAQKRSKELRIKHSNFLQSRFDMI